MDEVTRSLWIYSDSHIKVTISERQTDTKCCYADLTNVMNSPQNCILFNRRLGVNVNSQE